MLQKTALGTFIGTLLFLLASGLVAQSNDRLDELLAQAPAHWDSTAYLLLVSSAQLAEEATLDEAFQRAVSDGLVPSGVGPADPVSLEQLAYLVMKTQNLPGGLEWTFLPSSRAAYRELAYYDLINVTAGPQRLIAGDEVIRTLTSAVAARGRH